MSNDTTPRLIGAPNFRDMGGYVTGDGRRIRLQRVYRSDALSQLTVDDIKVLDALPIGLVCDVRSMRERTSFPNCWPVVHQVDNVHLDVSNDLRAANKELSRAMLADPTAQGAHAVMLTTYQAMPRAFVGRLATVFEWLTANDQALLVHCTAGKDRTGFLCAILMLALGVERSQVFSDYMLTAQRYGTSPLAANTTSGLKAAMGHELAPEVLKVLSGVNEEYLERALQTVDAEFGSLDNYLQVAGGLDPQRREALQTALLE